MAETARRTSHQSRIDWWRRDNSRRQQKAGPERHRVVPAARCQRCATFFALLEETCPREFTDVAGAGCGRASPTSPEHRREFCPPVSIVEPIAGALRTGDRVEQLLHAAAQGHH